ncbi:MAG TPA: Rieske 2Fe-2S domain-containing protein [Nitrososphaeraceae archaeon]|nr:Rieske 2Fe-2S domain-containing protein [Nitrososphaeraceae archaeon]
MKKHSSQSKFNGLSKDRGIVLEKEKLAIFKDSTGKEHRYSAVCTHLGCNVIWNDLEKSFDCPCHGSRFSGLTGKVINGPANSPLETKDNDV